MKLLILSQYFPPEIGAPQNRLFELAVRLRKLGVDITVLTAMPNYPQMEIHDAYVGKKYHYEEIEGIKIHRATIYVTKKRSIIARLRNYFSFVWSSYRIGKNNLNTQFDYIFCESPPLFLGISAIRLAKKTRSKLIFNVSDLWPESAEKMGIVTNKTFLKLATKLEEYLYKKSALISCQTKGIQENISSRFPLKKTYWLPNGVDLEYYNPTLYEQSTWRKDVGFTDEDVIFFYGGIIGHAQGLEIILETARKIQKGKFVLMGSGPEKQNLIELSKEYNLTNVFFMDPVKKKQMPFVLAQIDIAVVPLKKLDLFKGAIPSKIFEALAMEKPILLGVDGEAKELFIDQGNSGLFFEPESVIDMINCCETLIKNQQLRKELGKNGRHFVSQKFDRNNISQDFFNILNKLSQ